MEFNFQNAFQPATPPYTDSSGAEFDEAISSLLEQSPADGHSDLGSANELQNWLESQPIFNAYDDPFKSLQAGLMGDGSVDPRQGALMLSELQGLQELQQQQNNQTVPSAHIDSAHFQPSLPQPAQELAQGDKRKSSTATKRKAGESAATTKKQKQEAQKQRFPKPPQPVPPPPRHGGPKNPSHNAVERRYRNNINTRILSLRCAVPALVAQPPPQTTSRRKPPPLYVEGVAVPNKINKQTVLIGATDYIRRLRGREQRLMREVELLRAKLPVGEKELWESEWGATDDRDLFDEVEDFAPPDNAFVDLVDEPVEKSTDDQQEQQSQQSPSSEGSSAPRYLLGMFLSFGLFQKPYKQHQHAFRRHFEEGHIVSSTLPAGVDVGSHWKEHIIPNLLHPHVHDIIQTVLICLTLFVLLLPLLPRMKRNPITRAAQIGWMTVQRAAGFGAKSGASDQATIRHAQNQIYNGNAYSRIDKMHTHMKLSTSVHTRQSIVALATSALHAKSSKLWKEAQTSEGLQKEPKYVQLALERDVDDALQLCTMGGGDDLNVLQKIATNVSILALEELWSLIFKQMVEEKASVEDVQLINRAISQLVSSTRELPTIETMSIMSAAMWALLQGKKESALRLAERVNGSTASLKCLKVFRMLTNTSEDLDDIEDDDESPEIKFDRCDDLATIAMLYFSLKVSLQGVRDSKEQATSLYGLTLKLRSLLGSLDRRDGRLLEDSTFDAAIDCLQVTGYQLMGVKL